MKINLTLVGIMFLCSFLTLGETIKLRGNQTIQAEIIKQDDQRIIVDLGYDVLQIPKSEVVQILKQNETPEAPQEKKQDLFSTKKMPPASIRENINKFGGGVVKVSTPGGTGSGFIIDDRGYIITNAHVIGGERHISVTLFEPKNKKWEAKKYNFVKIIALNPFVDLALIKITTNPEKKDEKLPKFPIVYLGNIDQINEGDQVFCIGNPLGMERSISDGIISAKKRPFDGLLYVQTTAAINPGNSGGPLFNSRGEVIGVVNMKIMFGDNLGFAIPIDYLKHFLKNREAFRFDKYNANSGIRYYLPPAKKD